MATSALQVFCYIVTWTFYPLGILSSLIRIYCCQFVTKTWKPDDYMGVLTGAALVGALAFWQVGLSLGCGGPEPNKCNYFDPGGALVRYLYILSIYYTGMHFLIKSAFLTYYLRLSPNRRFRTWIGVGYGLNFGSLMVGLLLLVFQCIPVKAALTTLGRLSATCMDRNFVLFAPSSMNVLLDIYVFVLPIPTLAGLQMPLRKKIAVISVFAFGAGSVILGILRFHSVLKLLSINRTSNGVGETIIVVALELSLAAIAVNLPAIRSIFVKRSNARREATLTNGGSRSRPVQNVHRPLALRTKDAHEMSQLSSPARPSPLSDSREELWRNIEHANVDMPTQKKKMSRHEQYTTVDLS
ncbi:hypothetical protein HBI56_232140 [Parastagonospora nodorum]|uniref:Rhodopsin domain-containing protein n=2 Tax=Phaeosphaeria nodorum (strain SN15 / ATCC MYA-4574 / FGSC 10173) TaxID=321614 RepID=A0A7U2FAN6_PHANO|nr:hypothetical protein HBH56_235450 [Parastagonospora nodorum]QRC99530.1 hypothetical protein JI435_144370 [Parastagonospora nodorum SN15]KAH3924553.1 hypothetical protein HBH54_192940 [Parastagonospora nodorum]KAH3959435.1 hypothetical protein HBH52_243840 [Parastagonospora nodorum]KAH3993554.1 hypothetical protein HBI10_200650 [Parastagonospora nodorum]